LNAVLKERVALAEQKLKEIEQEKKKLEEKVSALEVENANLKQKQLSTVAAQSQENPRLEEGCYVFDGDNRLYCPACFDTKGKKHLTTAFIAGRRMCTVCKTVLGS
jgi:hypothetical protein